MTTVEPGDEDGVGKVVDVHPNGWLPYATERGLKHVRDLLSEVADRPGVETYGKRVRDALDRRIEGAYEALRR